MKRSKKLQVFQGPHNRRWYWRLVAGNGRTSAIGGEQFPTSSHAKRAAVSHFPGVSVTVLGLRRFPVSSVPRLSEVGCPTCRKAPVDGERGANEPDPRAEQVTMPAGHATRARSRKGPEDHA